MVAEEKLYARARVVRDALRVSPGPLALDTVDARSTPGLRAHPRRSATAWKAWSNARVAKLGQAIAGYQERLYAMGKAGGDRRRFLLVLQAMDCGGKDGTVRCVVGVMNPQGVRLTAFGPPSPAEREHPFLWRIEQALPPPGYVGVFNRSHYEDVLVARVRGLAPPDVIAARYNEINAFEQRLSADGMTIVKVFLHISSQEQAERLRARLDDPTKRWKFNPDDLDDRARWAEYQRAYELALARCSTPYAPWYVVPADRKWYRNWAVANLLLAHLSELGLRYPEPGFDVAALRRRLTKDPLQPDKGLNLAEPSANF